MNIKDLIVTPVFLIIFYLVAYAIRGKFTDQKTRQYFIPALSLKFLGAIALGLVYQFYYEGGDTYNFTVHGSKYIWNAFVDNPLYGLRLLLASGGEHFPETFAYSQKIWFYNDYKSYLIVRIAAFFDIFTFQTYSATALFFAFFSFMGSWMLFLTFYKLYRDLYRHLALAIFFVPSIFFWGSGILKDTITFGALGWLTYCTFEIVTHKRNVVRNLLLSVFFTWLIVSIKQYILFAFVASFAVYFYSSSIKNLPNRWARMIAAPLLLVFIVASGYFGWKGILGDNSEYSINNISRTVKITAYDIRYGWGARGGDNSGYTLGELDGSWSSMLKLAPAGINVSLFRPYLWEVKNPLMLLSAIESIFVTIFTFISLKRIRHNTRNLRNPYFRFCLSFSLLFAFAVGVSTFNFGTLMRYKLPLIPFYFISLILLNRSETRKETL